MKSVTSRNSILDTKPNSHLRLFLSVDVAGSTALKNELNHNTLKKWVKDACHARQCSPESVPEELFPNAMEIDWAATLEDVFHNIHSSLLIEIGKRKITEIPYPIHPWKALGDELIYSFPVASPRQASQLVNAFLSTVRTVDAACTSDNKRIRVKGSAWLAGFPLRNRIINLPMPGLITKDKQVDYPYPREDYLGPDMDIGFRIGKCSYPGMCVASMNLVELLARETGNQQMRDPHLDISDVLL